MRKFMHTRNREPSTSASSPPPAPLVDGHTHKTNGHANGAGNAGGAAARSPRDHHSTLSGRYWSGSEWSAGGEGEEDEVEGAPWEDPEFPANWRSIGNRRAAAGVTWMRPHELCARPTFLGCGAEPEEPDSELFAQRWRVELGPLGDPHLSCAAAALALTPRLLARVAPPQRPHPARRYRFTFWVWGEWRRVEVDDRLPCRGKVALGARGGVAGDFTLPLLEKAYAKLYRSYRALRAGSPARALRDLSGGVVQALAPRSMPRDVLLRVLRGAVPRSTLLVASAARCGRGVAARRAYAVTGLRGAALLRVRALGAAPPPREPDAELLAPGDFWMSLDEFRAAFSRLELAHVGPDDWLAEPALRGSRPWRAVVARRRWLAGYNAGGAPGSRHAHANPAFHVSVARACRLVVAVAQQPTPLPLAAVGVSVLALRPARALAVAVAEARPTRAREAACALALPAGRYLVVPHTRRAHTDRAFLLRILTDECADVWEENEDNALRHGAGAGVSAASRDLQAPAPGAGAGAGEEEEELDAARLRAALARRGARCSRSLSLALLALLDPALRGAVRATALPALLALLARWRRAYGAGAGATCCTRGASSYRARELLAAGGVLASNKVVEGVVARFARARRLPLDAYLVALARLHLAHERYRCLDAKLKCNPLSLEEMILMTIYS